MAYRIAFENRGQIPGVLVALAAAVIVLGTAAGPSRAGVPQSSVIVIDSLTTLPIRTGIYSVDGTGDIVVMAEGAIRPRTLNGRFELGWFGPAGQDHYEAVDQPIVDGMPYGALTVGFRDNPAAYQFMGRLGAFTAQPADAGSELRLSLNLSAADLAGMEGQITATVIFLPANSADVSRFEIRPSTPLPLATGVVAQTGDQFIVLPRGRLRDPLLPNSAYTDGNFGPEGLLGLVSATQPHADGPYGALYGDFDSVGAVFFIGDGGCWSAQPSDIGQDLELSLNTDAASQAGMGGKFVVTVIRVPATDPAGVSPPDNQAGLRMAAAPNPMRTAASIHFQLAAAGPVHLRVYDAQGRQVRSLLDETLATGAHAVTWEGEDESGRRLPSGTYYYQLSTRDGTDTGRLVVLD